jgi:hypothetical protein
MRTILALLVSAIFCLTPIHAQSTGMPMDLSTEKYGYKEDVSVGDARADQLRKSALAWLGDAYPAGPKVDKSTAGRLVLKGSITVPYVRVAEVDVKQTVTIEIRDGGYSYTITDFVVDFGNAAKPFEMQFSDRKGIMRHTHKRMTAMIEDLKRQMAGGGSAG